MRHFPSGTASAIPIPIVRHQRSPDSPLTTPLLVDCQPPFPAGRMPRCLHRPARGAGQALIPLGPAAHALSRGDMSRTPVRLPGQTNRSPRLQEESYSRAGRHCPPTARHRSTHAARRPAIRCTRPFVTHIRSVCATILRLDQGDLTEGGTLSHTYTLSRSCPSLGMVGTPTGRPGRLLPRLRRWQPAPCSEAPSSPSALSPSGGRTGRPAPHTPR